MVTLNALHSLDHPEMLQILKTLGCGSSLELRQSLCAECCVQDPCFNELTVI